MYSEENYIPLTKALEAKGWKWINHRLYAPNQTFWNEGVNNELLARSVVERLYEKTSVALERMPVVEHMYPDKEQYRSWMEDMRGFVIVLRELLSE